MIGNTDCMLSAALAYAGTLAWPVFPCAGKAPAISGSRGYLDASIEATVIERWWSSHPNANVGISCRDGGFFVVDVDPRNGGDLTWREIVDRLAPLPVTPVQRTGGGGLHVLFRAPESFRPCGKVGTGVDVKYRGHIIAAPSVHPGTGLRYEWQPDRHPLTIPVADAPSWLVDLVSPPSKPPAAEPHQHRPALPEGGASNARYALAALRHAALRVASAPIGQRNSTLNAEAFAISRFAQQGLLELQAVADVLATAALAAGEEPRKVASTLTSAFGARGL